MTPADRAIVAAAEERDRAVKADLGGRSLTPAWRTVADRRELLRIVREQEFDAERYRDALADIAMNGNPSTARDIARVVLGGKPDHGAEDRADDAAATEATAGKWK